MSLIIRNTNRGRDIIKTPTNKFLGTELIIIGSLEILHDRSSRLGKDEPQGHHLPS